jgi:Na+/proline symporter
MSRHVTWKSQLTDYAWYLAISLALVGFIIVVAIRVSDSDLSAQLVTAFFGACLLPAYILSTLWKRRAHRALLAYCLLIVCIHLGGFMFAYRLSGRTSAWLAAGAMILELALFSYLAERILPARRA